MSITFSQTARDVVTGAMRDMGIIRLSAQPTAAELSYGVDQLNLLLKDLAAQGLVPWTDLEAAATFEADEAEVELEPRPVAVSEARVVMANGYTRPLRQLSAGEYDLYPNRSQKGAPVAFEIRETPAAVTMRVWPLPAEDTTIAYSYSRVIEDVEAGEMLDVPQMWGLAVRDMLKARLTAFGPVDPRHEIKAEIAKQRLLDFSRPESYRLTAAPR